MRISDWSSDVCSSDLRRVSGTTRTYQRNCSELCQRGGERAAQYFASQHSASGSSPEFTSGCSIGAARTKKIVSLTANSGGHHVKRIGCQGLLRNNYFPSHLPPNFLMRLSRSEEHTSELKSLMRLS